MNFSTRLSEWIIPQSLQFGCFGPGSRIVGYHIDSDRKGKDQFASTVQFLNFTVQINDILREINVVIKLQPENQVIRELIRSKGQFENEVLMYSEILPMIDMDGIVEEIFCKYYCGTTEPTPEYDKDFVMLEDLSKNHYRLSSEKVYLDYDHCVLALKEIGRFHALSYAAKKKFPEEFMQAVSKIKEKWDVERLNSWKYKFLFCGQRGILPLIDKQQSVETLKEFLKNYDDPVKFYLSLVNPVEPEAVLCHGDFCRNNMFFLYDDNGKPVSVKFFDLQTPRYSSPVIDLSFFLLMNTSKKTREVHWDDFLNVYKNSVKSTIPHLIIPELDFRRVAIYGYLHCSFFLPIMITTDISLPFEEFVKLTPYEQGLVMSRTGGKSESEVLADIIYFLLEKDYIRTKYY